MQDTYKFKGMRKQLIALLRQDERITNEAIFEAFDQVPRHFFLDLVFAEQAYSNTAFQIGAGQTISHPVTVAFQTQLLEVKRALYNLKNDEARLSETLSEKSRLTTNLTNKLELQSNQFNSFKAAVN